MTVNLISSHQNRIQCLLAALEKESNQIDTQNLNKKKEERFDGVILPPNSEYQEYNVYALDDPRFKPNETIDEMTSKVERPSKKDKAKKIRFKNGAILHVKFELPNLLTVSMVYEGQLGTKDDALRLANEKPYYGTAPAGTPSKTRRKMRTNYLSLKKPTVIFKGDVKFETKTFKTSHKYLDDFECYLIRHGEADHNVNKISPISERKTWYDTDLTDIGKDQAKNSAEALFKYLNLQPRIVDKMLFFASDLRRTFLTLNAFKEQFQSAEIKMYLLPCSHEVKSEKSNCDEKEAWWFTAPENKPVWSHLEKNSKMMDTQMYRDFYPSGIRESRTISRTLRCRNTNMLVLADTIIKQERQQTLEQTLEQERQERQQTLEQERQQKLEQTLKQEEQERQQTLQERREQHAKTAISMKEENEKRAAVYQRNYDAIKAKGLIKNIKPENENALALKYANALDEDVLQQVNWAAENKELLAKEALKWDKWEAKHREVLAKEALAHTGGTNRKRLRKTKKRR
jgi:hypothetical protein